MLDTDLNGQTATASMDPGANLTIKNFSFVRDLGLFMDPHVLDVKIADNCWLETAGLVQLQMKVCGVSVVITFSVCGRFGSTMYDAVIRSIILEVPGIPVEVSEARLLCAGDYTLRLSQTNGADEVKVPEGSAALVIGVHW